MAKIDIAVTGVAGTSAFAQVAQQIAYKIHEGHPYFNLAALIADDPEHAGKAASECMTWYGPQDLPESLANMTMMPADPDSLGNAGDIKLVISAIPPWVDTKVDTIFPESGIPLLSESPLYRFEPDVPLVVPEINTDHLSILEDQKKKRGWKSFIVSNPVCTVTIITMSMKPIIDAFGINMCFQVTLQSMSGAGPKGLAAMDMVENMIPFIGKEEEKLEKEGPRILGSVGDGEILPNPMPLSTSCNRIPVLYGHTMCIFAQTERPTSVDEAKAVFAEWSGPPQELQLPSAPEKPIIVMEDEDRPQPRLDRARGQGMSICVGRIRVDPAFSQGIKWVVMGDNFVRGTAGNTILNAELLYAKDLL
jgi:aspartate-semialdehyde dehydrogenase